jgi:hypothetical protein
VQIETAIAVLCNQVVAKGDEMRPGLLRCCVIVAIVKRHANDKRFVVSLHWLLLLL